VSQNQHPKKNMNESNQRSLVERYAMVWNMALNSKTEDEHDLHTAELASLEATLKMNSVEILVTRLKFFLAQEAQSEQQKQWGIHFDDSFVYDVGAL
jgi:hypothetical protein